ncbi:glycosyltransferase family 32 protein [Kribbella sp. CA-293567]|uniref:glycosyltransferase family 32 protein n=1 Tax=Kribbella sp. CA-293567 TaxID=3002436 RepID=UPI0022DD8F2A|nr:glycosyltransferase [Kribbella sp. CA-293567]WBQ07608.1 glycosyltransferase [Kribbella sp. CA-293567]
MTFQLMQTWKTRDDLPPVFAQLRRTWLDNHPDANHLLVDDADILSWLATNETRFPGAIHTGLNPVRTADMFRYCHLFANGGMYADLDFYCLRGMTELLSRYTDEVVLGSMLMPPEEAEHSIPNAWMYAAAPGHPLWLVTLWLAAGRLTDDYIERATGPILLWDALHLYLTARSGAELRTWPGLTALAEANCVTIPDKLPGVVVLPPDMLYPLSWGFQQNYRLITDFRAVEFIGPELLERVPTTPSTYAFTYWAHSWGEDPLDCG